MPKTDLRLVDVVGAGSISLEQDDEIDLVIVTRNCGCLVEWRP
jgi:hypothetical protein